jgi:CRISPR type III-B/RAMP module-associated protein Cmr3
MQAPSTCFYGEIVVPTDNADMARKFFSTSRRVKFGGRNNACLLRPLNAEAANDTKGQPIIPQHINLEKVRKGGGQVRIALVTTSPTILDAGNVLHSISRVVVTSILADKPDSYSGWDLVRSSPKKTVYALPAGSVFYLTCSQSDLLSVYRQLCSLHGISPAPYGKFGWGTFLIGTWDPVRW